jgi:hypothetical protein
MAINIPIITDFDSRGIKKAEKAFGEIEKAGAKVGTSLKNALLPVGLALGGLAVAGAKFAMAAAEDQKSAALLARQLKVTTRATDAQVKSTEDFILQMSKVVVRKKCDLNVLQRPGRSKEKNGEC